MFFVWAVTDPGERQRSRITRYGNLAYGTTAQEAYGYYYAGDMPGAVTCSRSALSMPSSPSVGSVLAAALEMRAHAVMGDAPATMTTVSQ